MVQRNGQQLASHDVEGDRARIESYLLGLSEAFREIDGWVRIELRKRYARLRDEHEDLTQTVHGKLVQNLRKGSFEGRSALRTYVTGITHRTAIDRLRRLYQDRALDSSSSAEDEPGPDNPYRTLEAQDERKQLYQLMLNLPPACRELWAMVFVDKLSYEEVGEKLGIPPGTVKSRMFHCRQKATAAFRRMRLRVRSRMERGA